MRVPTLLVTGPVGVGKTTVLEEMSGLLRDAEIRHAIVSFDGLTACYPRPPYDDRWGTGIGMANLAAIWRNYAAAGIDRLLIACVIEDRAELVRYREAVPGAEITIVRLHASPATLVARVRHREQGFGLEWHLARAIELAAQVDRDALENVLVATDGKGPTAVAREALERVGWIPAR